ncbi:LLM class flavin-dependent oxidoreductase [Egicoccus sp. AB-alg2]|uniref:LLM class flavin-dependent oxidoreductase n=1 Tax=Egicoccus sp. AB-alg2 TaxID=3242693 RepID=UPI00359D240D
MQFGVHLPLTDFGQGLPSSAQLREYVVTAAALDYAALAVNDHLLWQRPWLDGPATLTAVHAQAGSMALVTSISLPVVRHPAVVAKWLTTLGCLTDQRIVAGLGPGSSAADYAVVGLPFDQRWARFDEAFAAVRALVRGEGPEGGDFYDLRDVHLAPVPEVAPEVWFGSWGSELRLRAMSRLADGWMASGYNTTPQRFAETRRRLDAHLRAAGRDPTTFPDLIATVWLYVSDDQAPAERLLRDVLAPILQRDARQLAAQLPIGSADHCIELLSAYAQAGARLLLLWPIHDPVQQLHVFHDRVTPWL